MVVSFSSCNDERIYERNIDIEKEGWKENTNLVYIFVVEDNSQPYNLLFNARYTYTYPYYNLYIENLLYDSLGREIKTKKPPLGMDLFKPTSGEPYGSGLGDIFDYRILALSNFKFPYQGKYKMKVRQFMRQDPLPGIVSFGFRIEKTQQK